VCRQVFVLTQTHATGAQRFIAYIGAFVNATMHLFFFLGTVIAAAFGLYAFAALVAHLAFDTPLPVDSCVAVASSVSVLAIALLFYGLVAVSTITTFANLCNVLSPELKPIDVSHIRVRDVIVAYIIYAPLIPAATFVTFLKRSILWSGV